MRKHVRSLLGIALSALVPCGAGCGDDQAPGDGLDSGAGLLDAQVSDAGEHRTDTGSAPDAGHDASLVAPDPYVVCSADDWCFDRP